MSATPSGRGYWVFTDRGIVFAYGDAIDHGGVGHVALNGPILDSVATPSGRGDRGDTVAPGGARE